jgi:23S rRNA (adenine2030-N6)-methyltransferase
LLSYRHSFHAGNFADVLKHIVLVEILEYLTTKEKAFEYVDSHAGAGLFDLTHGHAEKLEEYRDGIGKLWGGDWPGLPRYFEAIKDHNPSGTLKYYPGSPLIARHFLRPQDKAWLYELHPADVKRLEKNTRGNRQVRVTCQDGHQGLLAVLPPASRRGLVLIDPSYEIKSEYERVFETVSKACRKFETGIYAVWYPVVDRNRVQQLENNLVNSGIRDIQRFELGVAPDSDEGGMTASGMIVINPPWKLFEKMSGLLPGLAGVLSASDLPFYKCDRLVPE